MLKNHLQNSRTLKFLHIPKKPTKMLPQKIFHAKISRAAIFAKFCTSNFLKFKFFVVVFPKNLEYKKVSQKRYGQFLLGHICCCGERLDKIGGFVFV
jgi:hypothetical protein